MYGHGFATLALAEVYGMTRRRDLKPKIEAAIHLIEDTQNIDGQPRLDGGWRYQPRTGRRRYLRHRRAGARAPRRPQRRAQSHAVDHRSRSGLYETLRQ